ncbi:hypothetical protein [Yoonia sp.]|uniref:hypothetical protein n=1 Tax=Yoonia sp. TaxID=2212373 RepID=UPI00358FF10B
MILRIGLLSAFAVASISFFLFVGISNGDSARYNFPWTVQYQNAFDLGALLPRHLPGLWNGLGGFDFFFYAPIPFWFVAAFISPICPGCSQETQFVLGTAVLWLFSGVTFYFFIRRYLDRQGAIVGAFVFLLLPYHLWIDWFIRQAVGEFVAYAFLPLVALGIDAVRNRESSGWVLSIGVAGVFLSHLPTALLAAHIFGLVVICIVLQKVRAKDEPLRFLISVSGWAVLGGLLSCFYWLPAVALLETVSSPELYGDFAKAENWLYGLRFDQPHPFDARTILYSFLAVAPFIIVSGLLTRGTMLIWIIVPVALTVFLNIEVSEFIWKNWIISKVQFPWRMMVFVDFSAAIAISFLLTSKCVQHRVRIISLLVICSAFPIYVVAAHSATTLSTRFEKTNDSAGAVEYLSPEMLNVVKRRSNIDLGNQIVWSKTTVVISEIALESTDMHENFQSFESSPRRVEIVPASDVQRLSIPVQYWALWRAELEGGDPLELQPNSDFGTIDVLAPQDGFQGRKITLSIPFQTSELVGLVVSGIAILLLALMMFNARWPLFTRRVS